MLLVTVVAVSGISSADPVESAVSSTIVGTLVQLRARSRAALAFNHAETILVIEVVALSRWSSRT